MSINTKEIIKKYNIKLTKSLGQNFLIDESVIKNIVDSAEICDNDIVIEVGPGIGNMTCELAKKAKKVIAVEIDQNLKPDLPKNVELIYADALDLIEKKQFNKIISNIPYSISEPLLEKLLKLNFDLIVLLVGENFYSLLSKDSKLSIIADSFFKIEKISDVPRTSFDPSPRVDSVLIRIKKKLPSEKEKIIQEFVLQSDKKVKNALINALTRTKKLTQKQAKEKLKGIPDRLLDKLTSYLSNEQFKIICDYLNSL